MLFHIHCIDKADSGEVRAANRPDHLVYIQGFEDQIVIAGPMLSDDGEAMLGSVFIFDAPDRAAAEAFAADDPYAKAGLFESVTIRRFRQVIPAG